MYTNQKWNDEKTSTAKKWDECSVFAECISVNDSFFDIKNAK